MEHERKKSGLQPSTSFCIVDTQSVKNTDTACYKGYEAGKTISVIKRHIAVATRGLPHAFTVTTAQVNDRNGVPPMVLTQDDKPADVRSVLVDKRY